MRSCSALDTHLYRPDLITDKLTKICWCFPLLHCPIGRRPEMDTILPAAVCLRTSVSSINAVRKLCACNCRFPEQESFFSFLVGFVFSRVCPSAAVRSTISGWALYGMLGRKPGIASARWLPACSLGSPGVAFAQNLRANKLN